MLKKMDVQELYFQGSWFKLSLLPWTFSCRQSHWNSAVFNKGISTMWYLHLFLANDGNFTATPTTKVYPSAPVSSLTSHLLSLLYSPHESVGLILLLTLVFFSINWLKLFNLKTEESCSHISWAGTYEWMLAW